MVYFYKYMYYMYTCTVHCTTYMYTMWPTLLHLPAWFTVFVFHLRFLYTCVVHIHVYTHVMYVFSTFETWEEERSSHDTST